MCLCPKGLIADGGNPQSDHESPDDSESKDKVPDSEVWGKDESRDEHHGTHREYDEELAAGRDAAFVLIVPNLWSEVLIVEELTVELVGASGVEPPGEESKGRDGQPGEKDPEEGEGKREGASDDVEVPYYGVIGFQFRV